ncbi:MAG: ABC transporter substrate-binding protein [Brachybacterium tyrofermentans]|uniref:ABC transporter substrate-binding protein n=1 Tax=Brachybacterium tyrofermentans TaxID=47848 RepID=A0ABW0FB86_9MICO|nr:extracellular solute-binding protein [Brachybacterium tyrofermentans]
MPTRRQLLLSSAAMGVAGIGALTGCSEEAPPDVDDADTLRMRVWDDAAASAYETSMAAFSKESGIDVHVEVMGWDDYWKQLPLDVAGESLPDVLWMNTANLAEAHASGQLIEVGEVVADAAAQWEESATDLYRIDDALWGVPQVWDRSILVAHQELVEAAGGDAAELRFEPGAETDSLRDLAREITVDGEGLHPGDKGFDPAARAAFGFSAHPDRSAVLGPFIAGHGGAWQDEKGAFTFASQEGIEAVQYLADLTAGHLAPDGAEAVTDETLCQSLFVEGKLGLLQTGTYDLHVLAEGIKEAFPWSVHPPVAGAEGPRPLVHAVAAVGITPDDDEEREEAIGELLSWLGSVEGQRPLAENRLGIPAHRDLHSVWQEEWKADGVDVSVLAEAPGDVALPETGNRSAEGTGAALPIIAEVFTGTATAADALPKAQDAAEDATG